MGIKIQLKYQKICQVITTNKLQPNNILNNNYL